MSMEERKVNDNGWPYDEWLAEVARRLDTAVSSLPYYLWKDMWGDSIEPEQALVYFKEDNRDGIQR